MVFPVLDAERKPHQAVRHRHVRAAVLFSFRISPKGAVIGSDEDLCFQQRLLRDSYVLSVCTPKCPGSSPENTLQITEQLPAT